MKSKKKPLARYANGGKALLKQRGREYYSRIVKIRWKKERALKKALESK